MSTHTTPPQTAAAGRWYARLWAGLTRSPRSGAAWRVLAASEIQRLCDELELSAAPFALAAVTGDRDPAVYVDSVRAIVGGHLEQAADALVPVSRIAALRAWYTGSAVEQAWLNIHRASEALLMIQSPGSLMREFLEIDGGFRASIAAADPRYANLAHLLKQSNDVLLSDQPPDLISAIMRSKLKAVRNVANVASDTTHETVRRWRNLMVLGGVVLGGLSITVSLVHIFVPNFISLAPPGGWKGGSSVQPWEVILIGSLGGALAAVLALNRFSGFTDPSGLPVVQAMLRVPTAAATSLVGVLLMQTATLDVAQTPTRSDHFDLRVLLRIRAGAAAAGDRPPRRDGARAGAQ